jgi:hypothetical protein
MDAAYFWQKAATCLRLAQTLSSSNPGRVALLDMAQGFERRAKEIEAAKIEAARTGRSQAESSPSGFGGVSREIRARHRFG